MKIELYQIDTKKDREHNVCYMCLDSTLARAGKVDPKIYNKVYEGEVGCRDYEDVFRLFNLGKKPVKYSGRSMSVSDVLHVVESDYVVPGFYFCDSIGFKKIVFDPEAVCDGVEQ